MHNFFVCYAKILTGLATPMNNFLRDVNLV